MQDLMVALDDADGRILYARFFEQEGTISSLRALKHVLVRYGRFCELYTDRGSHFCRTSEGRNEPDDVQQGQVARVLKVLGIDHILARSPEARGRSERAFGHHRGSPSPRSYASPASPPTKLRRNTSTRYSSPTSTADLPSNRPSRRAPSCVSWESICGSSCRSRTTASYAATARFSFIPWPLQIPKKTRERRHYVRCPVLVHEFLDGNLGISYQGRLIARFTRNGILLPSKSLRQAA